MTLNGESLVYVLLVFLCFGWCKPNSYKIGAIFEDVRNENEQHMLMRAFITAIEDINVSNDYNFQFVPIPKFINNDPYEALNSTCFLLEQGVIAIFGPSFEENSNIVQSITDVKEIPHIEVRWDDHPQKGTINVHPYPDVLTRTYVDIIEEWGWKDFVILYENNESLQRVGELLKLFASSNHRIVTRQLKDEYRNVLKELWRSGATHFVLDCSIDILPEVLRQAQQVGLMTSNQHYIITNLDFHTIDSVPYRYGETNITGMRFVDPYDQNLKQVAARIYNMPTGMESAAGGILRLEVALLYDAVMMFAQAVKKAPPFNSYPVSLSCSDNCHTFSDGTTIINGMKHLDYKGLTGRINKFDNDGFRKNFALDVIELTEGGIPKVGVWKHSNSSHQYTNTRIYNDKVEVALDMRNRTFNVGITEIAPYGMIKKSSEKLEGNERYEGFAVDLIDELAKMKGFNYTIILMPSAVGNWDNATQRYTGLLGAIIDRKLDLVITDLTRTADREEVVDFTPPFMMLGIAVLYQKPKQAPPKFFSFADTFAFEVWKLLMFAWVGVSFILFFVGRISPTEWENPYPCIEEPEYLVNQLDLRNCAWFITGSIMQQGSEIELKSVGSRMVAGMWWFFTLLMVSSYTANLAASLTTQNTDVHFTNFKELVQNAEEKGIKYGAKKNGSTANFVRDKAATGDRYYKKAWDFMQKHEKEVMFSETKDGVEKSAKEQYAFLMESSSIEYEIQRRCNLQQATGKLDEKEYGIAMRKNESHIDAFSAAVLLLQSNGKLAELKRIWWEENIPGGACPGTSSTEEGGEALDIQNVTGVFGVTICGTVLAFFLAIVEVILHSYKKSAKTKIPFRTVLMKEIKFYFKFNTMVKPVFHGSSLGGSSESNKLQSEEKELPYSVVNKQTSIETLDSYTNSHKSKRNRKRTESVQ